MRPKTPIATWVGSGTALIAKLSKLIVPPEPLAPPLSVPVIVRVLPEASVKLEKSTEALFHVLFPAKVVEGLPPTLPTPPLILAVHVIPLGLLLESARL